VRLGKKKFVSAGLSCGPALCSEANWNRRHRLDV
jgi:hypothetical protein